MTLNSPTFQSKVCRFATFALLLSAWTSALPAQPSIAQQSADIESLALNVTRLADEYMAAFAIKNPVATELNGLQVRKHDRLTDNSQAARRAWQAAEDHWSDQLARIDLSALKGRPEWVTGNFLKEAVESSRQLRVCRYDLWPISQLDGWQNNLPVLIDAQPVGTRAARKEALARWKQLPRYLDVEVLNLREGVRLGYTTPKHNVELVIQQLDELLSKPIEQSPFYGPANRDTSAKFKRDWSALLTTQIQPAIERYRNYLRDEYLAAARVPIAITANPDGAACYQASFRASTTLNRAGAETFELGSRQVDRNRAEAIEIARSRYGVDSLAALVDRINTDTANHFTSRDQLLAFARDAVDRARTRLPQWFNKTPKADIAVEPYPDFLERTASDSYWPATQDGSRSAKYMIKLYGFSETTRSNTEITAFHESYPGHHLQVGLALEQPATAHAITRLLGNSGYSEGWARYAEALSEEMGLYSTDYARINRRLWPSRGMVIDPGIHLFGWTREQAIAFIVESGRFSPQFADALVDRIAVWPGQLTAYDTGAFEFFALREQAKQALGPRFDIREFHDVLLDSGSITLPMLREKIEAWIRSKG